MIYPNCGVDIEKFRQEKNFVKFRALMPNAGCRKAAFY
jgi:hypothetical protein